MQGGRDIPLNARGRDQAAAAGRILGGLLAERGLSAADLDFVASPLSRARETMTILRAALGMGEPGHFRLDGRLQELSFGSWEGRTWAELKASDPLRCAARRRDKWGFVPPGGESYAALRDRVEPWLDSFAQDTVVVGHGGVARVLLHILADVDRDRAPETDVFQGRVLRFADGAAAWV